MDQVISVLTGLPAGARFAWVAAALLGLLVVVALLIRRRNRRSTHPLGVVPLAEPQAQGAVDEAGESAGTDDLFGRIQPGRALLVVAVIAAGLWGLGLALTPSRARFLASREWHIQPIYLAAHILALALFVGVLRRNFESGLDRLDVDAEPVRAQVRLLVGPLGLMLACLIALPLGYLDFQYLLSARYEKLGGDGIVRAADLVMWGIWLLEWGINAFLWVLLAGFAMKSSQLLARHRFRAPIEVVLLERHYRPFLQMSAQGSTVLLAFSFVTVSYILYAGGEVSDFLGLGISVLLLLAGFFIPWMVLRRRVRRLVELETQALRLDLVQRIRGGMRPSTQAPLEARVEEMLAILRISNVEHLRTNLGWTEAKVLMLRLLAPAATIGWQLAQNAGDLGRRFAQMIQDFGAALAVWLG